MSYGALGLVEVVGSCNAVVVLDQMLKTSDVEFRTWHTKCGGHATVFLRWLIFRSFVPTIIWMLRC